jgi:RNA polymerase sigma-70 factor (ECF subfamily)
MSAPQDSRIVGEVLEGDVNAYALLVKKYQKPIYNLMYRASGSKEVSMDLSQETLVRAYEKLERFDPSKKFFPWLYAIGVNLARDYLRKVGRESHVFENTFDEDNTVDDKSNPVTQVERKLEMSNVLKAMEKLPFDHREALILRFREELSMKDIARALCISVSGAKMRVHRALKELRRILRKDLF